MTTKIKWHTVPEPKNYEAARYFLELILPPQTVANLISDLKKAKMSKFMAKDIFRASGVNMLGISNLKVKENKRKIRHEKPISPILLVRDIRTNKVIIADGYHRTCALYHFDEEAWIPCKIVTLYPHNII